MITLIQEIYLLIETTSLVYLYFELLSPLPKGDRNKIFIMYNELVCKNICHYEK